jgi:hypothetical protein
MDNSQMTEQDKMLWKQAKKRVSFRRHLFVYLIINGFVWAMWCMRFFHVDVDSDNGNMGENMHHFHIHGSPIFMTLGWGLGLAFHFYSAYFDNQSTAVEKEFQKLKNSGK